MPSKKKKYNSRFPPARIKKIMQTDEDVGKVAAPVPVIISRSLELFIESLIAKTAEITKARNAKTLSTTHIKQTIHAEKQFDFLHDLVANVPDHQPDEEEGPATSTGNPEVKQKRTYKPRQPKEGAGPGRRKKQETSGTSGGSTDDEETESEEETQMASASATSPPGAPPHPHPHPPGAMSMTQPPGALPHPTSDFKPYTHQRQEASPYHPGKHVSPEAHGTNYSMNNIANVPLNLSMSANIGPAGLPSPPQPPGPGSSGSSGSALPGTSSATVSFPALSNFMNMAAPSQSQNEDDDYDT